MGGRQDEYFLRFDDRLRINKEDWESCVRKPGEDRDAMGSFTNRRGSFGQQNIGMLNKDVYYKDIKYWDIQRYWLSCRSPPRWYSRIATRFSA